MTTPADPAEITPATTMPTTTAESVRTIPLPTFDGEHKNFQLWWTRFKAYAAVKKFAQAIKRTAEPSLPIAEATDSTTTPAQHAALERNMLAVANLTMAFQTESLMSLMYLSCQVLLSCQIRATTRDR